MTKQLYELEIPQKYFANCILPENLPPSFKTCNISRSYDLIITAKFSPEKITTPPPPPPLLHHHHQQIPPVVI